MSRKLSIFLVLLTLAQSCYFSEQTAPDQRFWDYASPASVGMNEDGLLALNNSLKEGHIGPLRSLILIRDDKLIFENYYHGNRRSSINNISRLGYISISLALGMAIDDGIISSIDDPIYTYLPDYSEIFEESEQKKQITIRHFMTMQTGLAWNEILTRFDDPNGDIQQLLNSSDWVEYILSQPIFATPGLRYTYNSAGPIVLTKIIEQASGQPYSDYLSEKVFRPLGVEGQVIESTPEGLPNSVWGMSMRFIDVVKMGYLFINEGKIRDQQTISSEWVSEAITTHVEINFDDDYALLWRKFSPFNQSIEVLFDENDIFYSLGVNGQVVYMIPHLDLVVGMDMDIDPQSAPFIGYWILTNQIIPNVQ